MIRPALKGMTWSHPRGYEPMLACSQIWLDRTGIAVDWDRRSLQDFESFPVEELARAYDLIVVDHPHVGQITAEKCLAPLDVPGREREFAEIADGSVGASFASYNWRGRQWAFPIDAAAQVQAWRSDLLPQAPRRWSEVMDLAREGHVLIPMRAPHSLMCFYTLCANLGHPCAAEANVLADPDAGARAFGMLREIAACLDPVCFEMDPIGVLELMGAADSKIVSAPLVYGYVSYSIAGFRPNRLAFADIPAVGEEGPVGSALGGTGIAVSAWSNDPKAAIDFAYWIASADVQKGPYAGAGGQPGHAAAWKDPAVNADSGDFYSSTRSTLEGAWMRPRHDGYMDFQNVASELISRALRQREDAQSLISQLNALYRDSFRSQPVQP